MTLAELNALPAEEAWRVLERCCGASTWVEFVCEHRPYTTRAALHAESEHAFDELDEDDWLEAFAHHPRIGDLDSLRERFGTTAAWAGQEQGRVGAAAPATLEALAAGNAAYESRFGYIFIVCATGRSAEEMLAALRHRLANDPNTELQIAGAEQRKITALRLDKLLDSGERKSK